MSTYIIGDIQGCFDSLMALLGQISFNPNRDQLGFVGDLVNRGPKSLETLRFIQSLSNPIVVLGNHDLHLLALFFNSAQKHHSTTLDAILNAPDCRQLIDWVLHQPIMIKHPTHDAVMVHAGIPPQWSTTTALTLAQETSLALQHDPKKFLSHMYGDLPSLWTDQLAGYDRHRYIINACTRMRFCTKNGELDLINKSNRTDNSHLKPWFQWRNESHKTILFGHWASLEGKCQSKNIIALDTGCLWGGKLTAIRLEDKQLFQVDPHE